MHKSIRIGLVLAALVIGATMSMAQGGGGGRGQGRGGQRGGNQFGEGALVRRADVQKDLGITDEQKTKLTDVQTKIQEEQRAAFQANQGNGGPPDAAAMQKMMTEMADKTHKALATVLDEKQMKRLGEISIQLRGNSAATDAKVQKDLGLSDDQVSKIKDLMAKSTEANRSIQEKTRNQEMTREEATAARAKNTKALNDEIGKVLTTEQSDKLKGMGGKKFTPDAPGGN